MFPNTRGYFFNFYSYDSGGGISAALKASWFEAAAGREAAAEKGGDSSSLSTRVTTVGHLRFSYSLQLVLKSVHTWTALSA